MPVKRQNIAKEKADYQKTKAWERKVKKEASVAPAREVSHKVWAEPHQGVDQKVVETGYLTTNARRVE